MTKGTHSYIEDTRNESILININGQLFPRQEAKISVFDSGFLLGDGVWETWSFNEESTGTVCSETSSTLSKTALMDSVHIAMWSGPRNISSAMMRSFENTLKRNIHDALNVTVPNAIDTIEKLRGRFLITLSETNTNSIDSILSTLENRFGLAYFAPAIKIHPELDSMKLSALEILKDITNSWTEHLWHRMLRLEGPQRRVCKG